MSAGRSGHDEREWGQHTGMLEMNMFLPFSLLPPRLLGMAALTSIARPSIVCCACSFVRK